MRHENPRSSSISMTGFVDKFPYIWRQFADKSQLVTLNRVLEAENRRVKRLSAELQPVENGTDAPWDAAINRIPQ
jgi:hypothetical protein